MTQQQEAQWLGLSTFLAEIGAQMAGISLAHKMLQVHGGIDWKWHHGTMHGNPARRRPANDRNFNQGE